MDRATVIGNVWICITKPMKKPRWVSIVNRFYASAPKKIGAPGLESKKNGLHFTALLSRRRKERRILIRFALHCRFVSSNRLPHFSFCTASSSCYWLGHLLRSEWQYMVEPLYTISLALPSLEGVRGRIQLDLVSSYYSIPPCSSSHVHLCPWGEQKTL